MIRRLAGARIAVAALSILNACGSASGPLPATQMAPTKRPESLVVATVGGDAGLPHAAPSETTDDPFASFETRSEESLAWEVAQTQRTIDTLHANPHFEKLKATLRGYREARELRKSVEIRGSTAFSIEQLPGGDQMAIFRTESGGRTKLFQVSDAEAAQRVRIDFISLSNKGRWLAVGTSESGTEETSVRILDARTGVERKDRSDDVRLGQVAWLPDDSGYLYMRGRGRGNLPAREHNKDLNIAYHVLGMPADHDVEVVGSRAAGAPIFQAYDYCYPTISPDGKYVAVLVRHGITPDMDVFVKPWSALARPDAEWAHLYTTSDHVTSVWLDRRRLVAVRAEGDGGFVEERALTGGGPPRRLYTSPMPLDSVFVADNAAYVIENHLATKRFVRLSSHTGPTPVELPGGRSVFPASVRIDPASGALVAELRSWTDIPSWWVVPPVGDARPLDPKRSANAGAAFSVRTLEIPARDGVGIPVTIVEQAGRGTAPPKYVWAAVYGSYGFVLAPSFTPARRAFLEQGGAYVAVHVRGGGEKGRSWHEQGRGKNKVRAIEDLIDVVKGLRSGGFGDGGGIFLTGASAGGIPAGGLLVREPASVDAVLIESGITNATRVESASAIGTMQLEEFGTMTEPESAVHVAEIDAYLHIRDGVKYPATMLIAGKNDVRVPPWQATKFAARLQRANAGASPIFVRMTGGGHVSGTTMEEDTATDAETLVFALTALHHPAVN